ncbi:MAG: hypothetical protein ACTJHT_08280 [Sphingobacterium sp.]|uniref:hypothetical protein n=1 Tax=Sphingobacterium sp. JB170 TaxID=1434842 RepID=UPI00097ED0E3|nr:hypothetical protein [Sphingobacterium sp. JB170]SJN47889.1 hypothetical protein FM107_16400 [Sphingobacterium sp. JB170]
MNQNFYVRFRVIKRKIASLELNTLTAQEDADFVLECSELLFAFLRDIQQVIRMQQQAAHNRYTLQKQHLHLINDQNARRQLLVDHVRHLRQTIDELQKSFFIRDEPCLLNLTAREILLFYRLVRDAGILNIEPDLASAFSFIELHFRTANQEHFSYESLRKKYYTLDEAQFLKMSKLLEKLVDVNKNYLSGNSATAL